VVLATRGQRDMDSGPVPMQGLTELAATRSQATRVKRWALILAVAATALAVAVG
jgi:hypothetical protein